MNKLVSIIIPVYNTVKYIDETIKNVTEQTYKEIEIILVDDGSNDGSGVVCDGWGERDPRIKVFHIDNSGPSFARNYGIEHSKGEYILPVDSDDLIADTYVEKAVDILEKDMELGIVYCRAEYIGEQSGEWKLPDYSIQEMLVRNCIFVTSMFRKKDYEKIGGFWDGMVSGFEDYDFWLSIIQLGRGVYRIPEVLFYYRKREDSRTENFNKCEKTVKEHDFIKYQRHKELYSRIYRTIDNNKKIILYGAGGAGEAYYNFNKSIGNDSICLWVDKNYEQINARKSGFMVDNPERIFQIYSDAVVIALIDRDVVERVKEYLIENGYNPDNIYYYVNDSL